MSFRFIVLSMMILLPFKAVAQTSPDFLEFDVKPFNKRSAPNSAKAHSDMIEIAGGTYTIGSDGGPRSSRPAHEQRVMTFKIDRTEVTNNAFAEFLNAFSIDILHDFEAGNISQGDVADSLIGLLIEGRRDGTYYPLIALDDNEARIGAKDGRFVPTSGFGNHPAAETTWAGAHAYCRWRGGRLPTEVEWEVAARGNDQRAYPWGNDEPDRKRVHSSKVAADTEPVGSRPIGASPFQVLDMAGSLAEWTSSLKKPYPYLADDGREEFAMRGERVTRGGDYQYDTDPAQRTVFFRDGFSNAPDVGHRHIGFRCVQSK